MLPRSSSPATYWPFGSAAISPLPLSPIPSTGARQQTESPEVPSMTTQQPIARSRAGSISCALWENEIQVNGTSKTVLKASVSRRYKDNVGNWKSSQSFRRNGIPLAVCCPEKTVEEEQAQRQQRRCKELRCGWRVGYLRQVAAPAIGLSRTRSADVGPCGPAGSGDPSCQRPSGIVALPQTETDPWDDTRCSSPGCVCSIQLARWTVP